MKFIPETRHIFRRASDLGTRIIRKPRIPGARVCLFAGRAVNNIVNNKNHDQRHQKRIKNSKLYFKIRKTWKNWESTRITSITFPFLRTSFPIPSGQIPVLATQIPFFQSKNRSIPVPILPLQDPLGMLFCIL